MARSLPRRSDRRPVRRSSSSGTGGRRQPGRGKDAGDARPSPGTPPPGMPDLRDGAEVTVTTGPVSDAIERLQAQHREIAALLARGSRSVARLTDAMSRHRREEEELFYPAFRTAAGRTAAALLTGDAARHRDIERLLRDWHGEPAGAKRRQRFDDLKAHIQEHVREVESAIFPEALRRLSRPQRVSLGERMDLLAQES